jgi:hypothetical protein
MIGLFRYATAITLCGIMWYCSDDGLAERYGIDALADIPLSDFALVFGLLALSSRALSPCSGRERD